MRMNPWSRVGTLVAITGLAACAANPVPAGAVAALVIARQTGGDLGPVL